LAAASAGPDGALVLWDLDTGKELWRSAVAKFGDGAGTVFFFPHGKQQVLLGCESTALGKGVAPVVLHALTGQAPFGCVLVKPGTAALSPDGELLALGDGSGPVHLRDSMGRLVRSWNGANGVTALAFLPGGTKVLVADGGQAICILDATNGKEGTAF